MHYLLCVKVMLKYGIIHDLSMIFMAEAHFNRNKCTQVLMISQPYNPCHDVRCELLSTHTFFVIYVYLAFRPLGFSCFGFRHLV